MEKDLVIAAWMWTPKQPLGNQITRERPTISARRAAKKPSIKNLRNMCKRQ